MADNPPNTPPKAPETPPPPKWNGKFADDADLLKGAVELGTHLKMFPSGIDLTAIKPEEIVGDGKLFKSFDDVSIFYKGLEVAQGKASGTPPQTPTTPPKTPETPPKPADNPLDAMFTAPNEDDADLASTFSKVGVDVVSVIAEGRDLSDEELGKLKTLGLGKKAATELLATFKGAAAQHIEQKKAVVSGAIKQAEAKAGGSDKLKNLMQWGMANIPADMAGYKAMTDANPQTLPAIVELIQTKHAAATGKATAPQIASGSAAPSGGAQGFTSTREFSQACARALNLRTSGTPDAALEARIMATDKQYQR